MPLPITDDFVGDDGDPIDGRTTTTGGATWSATGGWELNADRAYNNSGGNQYATVDAAVSDYSVTGIAMEVTNLPILIVRANAGLTVFLQVWVSSSSLLLYDESSNLLGSATGLSLGFAPDVTVNCNGSAISVEVGGDTLLTATTSHGLTNTHVGIAGVPSAVVGGFDAQPFTVSTPSASLTRATPTTAYLQGASGSSGTPPYTFQWQRSTEPDGGFTDLTDGGGISGATTTALTDGSAGIAAGTRYWYQLVVTDSLAADFTSNVQSAGRWKVPAYVLFIGDSVTAGGTGGAPSPVDTFEEAILKAGGGQRDVLTYNAAEGGLSAFDWYDVSDVGHEVQPRLVAAADNGLLAGCTHGMVTLGINDAAGGETPEDFAANMAGIGAYLLSRGFEGVIYNLPTGVPQLPDAPDLLTKLLVLAAEIPDLTNGTDLLLGDTLMIDYLPDHAQAELQDGGANVHPNATGAVSVGEAWAFGWAVAVGDVQSGVSPEQIAYGVWVAYPNRTLTA